MGLYVNEQRGQKATNVGCLYQVLQGYPKEEQNGKLKIKGLKEETLRNRSGSKKI